MRVISRSTEPKLVAIPRLLVAVLLNRLVLDFSGFPSPFCLPNTLSLKSHYGDALHDYCHRMAECIGQLSLEKGRNVILFRVGLGEAPGRMLCIAIRLAHLGAGEFPIGRFLSEEHHLPLSRATWGALLALGVCSLVNQGWLTGFTTLPSEALFADFSIEAGGRLHSGSLWLSPLGRCSPFGEECPLGTARNEM